MELQIFNLDKAIEIVQSNKKADTLELVTSLLVIADNYLLSKGYTSVEELPLSVKQQVNPGILREGLYRTSSGDPRKHRLQHRSLSIRIRL